MQEVARRRTSSVRRITASLIVLCATVLGVTDAADATDPAPASSQSLRFPTGAVVAALKAPDGTLGVLSVDRFDGVGTVTTIDPQLTVERHSVGLLPMRSTSTVLGYSVQSGEWLVFSSSSTIVTGVAVRPGDTFRRLGTVSTSARSTIVFDDPVDPSFLLRSSVSGVESDYVHELLPLDLGHRFERSATRTVDLGGHVAVQDMRRVDDQLLLLVRSADTAEVWRSELDLSSWTTTVQGVVASPLGRLVIDDRVWIDAGGSNAYALDRLGRRDVNADDDRFIDVEPSLASLDDVHLRYEEREEDGRLLLRVVDLDSPTEPAREIELGDGSDRTNPVVLVAEVGDHVVVTRADGSAVAVPPKSVEHQNAAAATALPIPVGSDFDSVPLVFGVPTVTSSGGWQESGGDETESLLSTGRGLTRLDATCRAVPLDVDLQPTAPATRVGQAEIVPSGRRVFVVDAAGAASHLDVPIGVDGDVTVVGAGELDEFLVLAETPTGLHAWLFDLEGAQLAGPTRVGPLLRFDLIEAVYDPIRDRFLIARTDGTLVDLDRAPFEVASSARLPVVGRLVEVAVDPASGRTATVIGSTYSGQTHVVVVDVDGGTLSWSLLPDVNTHDADVVVDGPNGRFILAASHLHAGRTELYELPISGGEPSLLAGFDVDPFFPRTDLLFDAEDGRGVLLQSVVTEGDFGVRRSTGTKLVPFSVGGSAPASCDVAPNDDSSVAPRPGLVLPFGTPLDGAPQSPGPVGFPGSGDAGYLVLTSQGTAVGFGSATEHGGAASAVDLAMHPSGDGYWVLGTGGIVTAHGDAEFFGNGDRWATAIVPTSSGDGYLVVDSSGKVQAFGNAVQRGDLPTLGVDVGQNVIVDAVAAPDGDGYWLVGRDGGVFAFGSVLFHGSIPQVLPSGAHDVAIVAIGAAVDGDGYTLFGSDGGVFTFGSAVFRGSLPGVLGPGVDLIGEIVGAVTTDHGYLMLGLDGGIFAFGDAPYLGSLAGFGPGYVSRPWGQGDLIPYVADIALVRR